MIKLLDINLTNDQFAKVNSHVINTYKLFEWESFTKDNKREIIREITMESFCDGCECEDKSECSKCIEEYYNNRFQE